MAALLVLATYEHFLSSKGLRYLMLLNLFCSAVGVVFSTVVCASIIPPILHCHKTHLRNTVWIHQPWATYIAPLSFTFDLIGGGEMVRLTIIPTCIAQISRPENLYVDTLAYPSYRRHLASVVDRAYAS